MLNDHKLTWDSVLRFLIRNYFTERISIAPSYQCAEMIFFFAFPWKKTSAKNSNWLSHFLMFLINEGHIANSPFAQLFQNLELQMGRTTCYVYFGRRTVWPSSKQSCCPKDSQKWAKPAGLGTASPLLASPGIELRVLRAAYWNPFLIYWP